MKSKYRLSIKIWSIVALPVLIFGVVFIGMAFNASDFENLNNLSRTTKNGQDSGPPNIKTRDSRIAVVWADGFNDDEDTKEAGNIYLKSAIEGTGANEGYWRAKLPVFVADINNWGIDPDFVFDEVNNNLVHVVWSQGSNCNNAIFNCDFQSLQYRRCNISDNINTCEAPKLVAQTSAANESMINPKIAHDGTDLHVIWQVVDDNQQTPDIFRYRRSTNIGDSWSAITEIPALAGGQDTNLLYNNGRLHIVWDEADAITGQREISYFRDTNDDDDQIIVQGKQTFKGFSVDYTNEDAGNPTLIGSGNWLFIGFDVRKKNISSNASNDKFFGLFYTMSDDNGNSWLNVNSIPDQDTPTEFESNLLADTDHALKPQLAISSTGTVTQLNAIWHEKVPVSIPGGVIRKYRASFSSLTLNAPIGGGTPDWSQPEIVTFPEQDDPEDISEDTIIPNIAFTDFGSNPGTGNLTFQQVNLQDTAANRRADVFYVGGISGTIDPEYILDEFEGPNGGGDNRTNFKKVTPTKIVTEVVPPAPIKLDYIIEFTNKGNLDFIGLSFVDTLPAGTTFNNDINPPIATYDGGNHTINWNGNVPKGQTVRITFSVQTPNDLKLPVTIRNRLDLYSIGAEAPLTSFAQTEIAATFAFLPIIFK